MASTNGVVEGRIILSWHQPMVWLRDRIILLFYEINDFELMHYSTFLKEK
jgi:hypothetical protein